MKPKKLYGHSGDLGDIVACLPTIRAQCPGHLVIFNRTMKIPGVLNIRESMKGKRFEAIKPLLEIQPYIESVTWSDVIPNIMDDFSTFRHDHILGESLLEWQGRHIGVTASTEPWLSGITARRGLTGRIAVARTPRYQNWQFPWPAIVKTHRDRILFIGLPAEHEEFQKLVGPVEYCPTANMLEVAEVIAGSDILIANQTAACWIGLGMGHPLIQEQSPVTRDSMIPRANAQYCLYDAMPNIPSKTSAVISIAEKPKKTMTPTGMTVVFPFYNGDRDLAQSLAEHIRALGGVENHKCLIICPDGTDRAGIEEPLREAFGSLDVHTYQPTVQRWPSGSRHEKLGGWPQGPNEMFAQAAMLIDNDPRFGDFFWMEMDCAPRGSTWADQIQRAHQQGGLPMLGVVTNTVHMDSRQVVGRHVVGVAVYPKNFATLCPLVRSIVQTSKEYVMAGQIPKAFDAYFGPYTVGRTSETRLIQHLWRAKNFHQAGDTIYAEEVTGPERDVSPEAVLVHGGKDDSLLRIFSQSGNDVRVANRTGKPDLAIAEMVAKAETPDEKLKKEHGRIGPAIIAIGTTVLDSTPLEKKGVTYPLVPKRGKPHVPMAKELWNRGEDGLPVPPFLPGQPEWIRHRQLMAERWGKDGFTKLRNYARKNLKINTLRMKAEEIAEACVMAERVKGKEAWTKECAPPWFPPKPDPDGIQDAPPLPPVPLNDPSLHTHADPSNPAGWKSVDAPINGPDEITAAMKQRMIELRERRAAATA